MSTLLAASAYRTDSENLSALFASLGAALMLAALLGVWKLLRYAVDRLWRAIRSSGQSPR